jgi:hypothetical protein
MSIVAELGDTVMDNPLFTVTVAVVEVLALAVGDAESVTIK